MRLKPSQIDSFLKNDAAELCLALLYGPDEGLVRERAGELIKRVTGDSADPFGQLDLTEEEFRADPTRIRDEFGAISMFGGRKAIRIRLNSDRYGKVISELVNDIESGSLSGDACIVIEAGDLKPSSALRKTFEKSKIAAALPCYQDDDRSIKRLAISMLSESGLRASNDALELIARLLGADRSATRQELEKLVLYKVNDPDKDVSLKDIQACLDAANTLGLEDLCYSVFSGDLVLLPAALDRCFLENAQPVPIVRSLIRHGERLQLVRLQLDRGTPLDKAVAQLRPSLHFSRKSAFERQVQRWSAARIERALMFLYDTERECKTTGLPAQTICAQTSIRLARAAVA